jgi:uncharacterized membrane protein
MALLVKSIAQFADTALQTSTWLPFTIPGLGLVVSLVIILLAGFLGRNLFGRYIFKYSHEFLTRVPVFGPLYNSIAQVFETILSNKNRSFSRAVLVPYPSDKTWALAFVTSENAPDEIQKLSADKLICVFVPTTPNPTSGFYLYVPEKNAKPTHYTVEQALKIVVTLGMAGVPAGGAAHGN